MLIWLKFICCSSGLLVVVCECVCVSMVSMMCSCVLVWVVLWCLCVRFLKLVVCVSFDD